MKIICKGNPCYDSCFHGHQIVSGSVHRAMFLRAADLGLLQQHIVNCKIDVFYLYFMAHKNLIYPRITVFPPATHPKKSQKCSLKNQVCVCAPWNSSEGIISGGFFALLCLHLTIGSSLSSITREKGDITTLRVITFPIFPP